MDKPLFDKPKDNNADVKQSVSAAVPAADSFTPVGAYNPKLTALNYQKESELRWDATPKGRAAIRLFSRGILGAAAFAWGGQYAIRSMKGYKYNYAENTVNLSAKSSFTHYLQNPLHAVAVAIDNTFGQSIFEVGKIVNGGNVEAAERWVQFRPTTFDVVSRMSPNRSLGAESVGITFDFFCASIGDAFGRDLASNIDPNNKQKFWKDKHGHASLSAAISNIGKGAWRYVSYNGGEDWAVAIPYAYYLRGQRSVINHFSPGFRYDSDRGYNGASFKVDKNANVVGNYNLEGMLDLQGRFTAYNVGTLMYREVYNHGKALIQGKESALYGTPEEAKKHHGLQKVGDVFKWGVRSAVKGTMYMTPAVPFFSIFRTSQNKYRGLFVNPESEGILSFHGVKGKDEAVHANELRRTVESGKPRPFTENTPVFFETHLPETNKWNNLPVPAPNPLRHTHFDVHAQTKTFLGKSVDVIGRVQNDIRSKANDQYQNVNDAVNGTFDTKIKIDKKDIDRYVNAAFAYTPYMYAKAEAANWLDNGKTDMAIERAIDGATHFNWNEFKAGVGETWRASLHKSFKDPAREAQAKLRVKTDTSPSEDLTEDQSQAIRSSKRSASAPTWQERIIQGKALEEEAKNLLPKPDKKKLAKNHAEQEAMRKVLQEATPPTNSIH